MTNIRKRTKQNVPLIIESHPVGYDGFPFITLLQFRHEHILTIVDNSDDRIIKTYVLDMCGPEKINEEIILDVAADWFQHRNTLHPLSIEFAQRDLTHISSKIYKSFDTEFISRVIGPLPYFPMLDNIKIKKRRKKPISASVQIVKASPFDFSV